MGSWIKDGTYPFAEVYDTDYKPEGAESTAEQIIKQAWPQFVAILESGARAVGVGPEQISIHREYERPEKLTYHEGLYASGITAKHGVTLSGSEINVEQLIKEGAEQAAKDAVVEGLVATFPGLAPGAGAIKAGIKLVENRDWLKTPAGRLQAGFMIASTIPVINIFVGPAQLALAAKSFIDAQKAVEEAKKEAKRAEEFVKMVRSYIDAAIPEAKGLAIALAERGYEVMAQPSGDFANRLWQHYHELVYTKIRDINEQIKKEKAEFLLKGGLKRIVSSTGEAGGLSPYSQGSGADWTMQFEPRKLEFGRKQNLQLFLQLARDMRKLREAIEKGISAKGSIAKVASEVSGEIMGLVAQILAKDPTIPYQSAVNMAAGIARGTREPLSQPEQQVIGAKVAEKVEAVRVNDNKISVGLMAALTVLRFLK